jgi:hypothetical protein
MPVVFRPARAEELQRAEELVVRSINDLTERHGLGAMATLRLLQFRLFSLRDDPDGLWVAEDAGEMVGFAFRRKSSQHCGRAWHAHHVADGAAVGARFWRLEAVSAPQSGFHVTAGLAPEF